MIEVKDLTKNYGTFPAVKRVSFSIGKGEVVGLLGPNGAGKTTIMKVLTCYHYPDGGTAALNGFDVVREPLAVKRQIVFLQHGGQRNDFNDITRLVEHGHHAVPDDGLDNITVFTQLFFQS